MPKYAPTGIPTPVNTFVQKELSKFESFQKKYFLSGETNQYYQATEKQKYADWLNQEIVFFKKEISDYKNKTYYPAKKNLAFKEASSSFKLIDITSYKQSGSRINFYIRNAGYSFTLPTTGDWIFIQDLTGGDPYRWGGSDGAVLKIIAKNWTSSPVTVTISGDSSPTTVPAWSFIVTVGSTHTDSVATPVFGSGVISTAPDSTYGTTFEGHQKSLTAFQGAKKDYKTATVNLAALNSYLKDLEKKAGLGSNSGTTSTTNTSTTTSDTNTPTIVNDTDSPVAYNIPSVKWAYFNNSGNSDTTGYSSILLNSGGSPAAVGLVKNANQLWASVNQGSHKGMFQTYTYWKLASKGTKDITKQDPNLPDWYLGGSHQTKKYGFQFLYNPGTVQMGWGGTPYVDPGLIMSGKDVTPYITPSQTSSWISFDLIINRMPDMALLNSKGASEVAKNLTEVYGLPQSKDDLAPSGTRYSDELKTIQELGTMYDIEYLLSTLVGFREFSKLRGRYTADFGFLLGVPVELHLGKQMRYVGTILDFSVTHTIFSEGMVPIFTNLSITFSRRVEPFYSSKGKAQIDGNGSLLNPNNVLTNDTQSFYGKKY
jgi:hypothetical protein